MLVMRGGTNSWIAGLGTVTNVNIDINQNINQLQNVEVNVLNDAGTIGSSFSPLRLDVNPMQWAHVRVIL